MFQNQWVGCVEDHLLTILFQNPARRDSTTAEMQRRRGQERARPPLAGVQLMHPGGIFVKEIGHAAGCGNCEMSRSAEENACLAHEGHAERDVHGFPALRVSTFGALADDC